MGFYHIFRINKRFRTEKAGVLLPRLAPSCFKGRRPIGGGKLDQAKQNEFFSILNQVADIPRPRLDYSALMNATLAGLEFLRRLMEIQGFFMALYRATGKVPVTKKGVKDILVASMNITPSSLAEIYNASSDKPLVHLLADLKFEELFIGAELVTRLIDKRIGTVLVLAPFFDGPEPSVKWYEKNFKLKLGPKKKDQLVTSKADDLPEASY